MNPNTVPPIACSIKGQIMSFSTERALNLLRIIEKREEISQREVAEFMDVSLGTANQTIRA
jgi:Mn-dependent DtxR family transcriptional regulator